MSAPAGRRLAWPWSRSGTAAVATAVAALLVSLQPWPLLPIARAYRDLCVQLPMLALVTGHLSPLPIALLVSLLTFAVTSGSFVGGHRLVRTLRFNARISQHASPLPPRLEQVGAQLGIGDRLTCLDVPVPIACCYGFLRPRIAVSASLLECLDDVELVAVLAHERHHLKRRDPLRYLVLHSLTAAGALFPIISAVQRHVETRIELAADRAALTVVPRRALAGALLVVLKNATPAWTGAARLSPTEARIAQLAGTPTFPAIPVQAALASLALVAVIGLALVNLSMSAHHVPMICRFCAHAMS